MAFEMGGRPGETGGALSVAGAGHSAGVAAGFGAPGTIAHCNHARSWSVEVRTGRIVAAPCRQCEQPWESPDGAGA
jgi:hypothetical protein